MYNNKAFGSAYGNLKSSFLRDCLLVWTYASFY